MTREPVPFEGLGPCYFERVAFRAPRKGEFYLSGAIVAAYRAPADLESRYHVVRPTFKALRVSAWQKGDSL